MAYSHPLAKVKSRLQIRSHLVRQCLAEFLGVFVLMILTQGAVAQAVTSGEGKGNFFTMFLAASLAVTIAIYVSGNVSGAHLNPAFSLAMCLLGRLPWAKLPIYCLVQLLSAFCASGATYALYYGNVVRSICMWLGVPCSDFEPMKMEILGVLLPCRCPTELYRWEPDSDGPQGDGLHICHLPCPLSVPEQWLPGSGSGHRDPDCGDLGHPGHTEQRSACGSGACGCWAADPGHWAIHGCQLWVPTQPRPGPGPTAFHLRGRLGP